MIYDWSILAVHPMMLTHGQGRNTPDVFDELQVFDDINAATNDCSVVIGTSGKRETGEKTLFDIFSTRGPWWSASFSPAVVLPSCLVRKGKGLSSQELEACDYYVTLPTWEGYPIANLSHAVNALLYEVHRWRVLHHQGEDPGLPAIVPLEVNLDPTVRKMLVKAIEQFAASTGTTEERKASIEQTLRRTLLKGSPSNEESTRMIGAFVEATTALQFASGDEAWKKNHRRRLE